MSGGKCPVCGKSTAGVITRKCPYCMRDGICAEHFKGDICSDCLPEFSTESAESRVEAGGIASKTDMWAFINEFELEIKNRVDPDNYTREVIPLYELAKHRLKHRLEQGVITKKQYRVWLGNLKGTVLSNQPERVAKRNRQTYIIIYLILLFGGLALLIPWISQLVKKALR